MLGKLAKIVSEKRSFLGNGLVFSTHTTQSICGGIFCVCTILGLSVGCRIEESALSFKSILSCSKVLLEVICIGHSSVAKNPTSCLQEFESALRSKSILFCQRVVLELICIGTFFDIKDSYEVGEGKCLHAFEFNYWVMIEVVGQLESFIRKLGLWYMCYPNYICWPFCSIFS